MSLFVHEFQNRILLTVKFHVWFIVLVKYKEKALLQDSCNNIDLHRGLDQRCNGATSNIRMAPKSNSIVYYTGWYFSSSMY
jgi:hypothetical protein